MRPSTRRLALVEPAARRRRLDHRVLAAHVVGEERRVEALAHRPDHVEVGKRRLDHDRVGALGEVELALAERLADVGRVHLVAPPVAEGRRRVGRLAERAVEGGGVLGRVGDDRQLLEALGVERPADRADAAVEHVARADGVGARLGVAHGRLREQLERDVVQDLVALDDAAVAVRRVLAEADVGEEHEPGGLLPQRPERALDDPVVVVGARRGLVLLLGDPEEETARTPARCAASASRQSSSTERWAIPGSPSSGRSTPSPGQTKSG